MKNAYFESVMIFIPVLISLPSLSAKGYWFCVAAVVSSFFCVAKCRLSQRHKKLYLFVYIALVTALYNIRLALFLSDALCLFFLDRPAMKFLYFPIAYAFILSTEEIILGLIGCFIWERVGKNLAHPDPHSSWKKIR